MTWRSGQARSDDLLAGFTPPPALLAGSADAAGEGFEAVLGDEGVEHVQERGEVVAGQFVRLARRSPRMFSASCRGRRGMS